MNRSDEFDAIRQIADCVCNETVTPEQVKTLEKMLLGNQRAQQFYFDYISMHVHLTTDIEPNMEVVRRSLHIDETIIRPISGQAANLTTAPLEPSLRPLDNIPEPRAAITSHYQAPEQSFKLRAGHWFLAAIVFILMVMGYYLVSLLSQDYYAKLESGNLTASKVGQLDDHYLFAGDYQVDNHAELSLFGGDKIYLSESARFKLFNRTELALYQGKLRLHPNTSHSIKIDGSNFTIFSEGGVLDLDLTSTEPTVLTGENTILMPKRWRPKHYWSFEGRGDRALDFAGEAHGIADSGATRVSGLVGKGAFDFDNTLNARINVGSGGGTVPATGTFAVTDGVTIEAMIKPKYSGEYGELDEIFRKDQTDDKLRMLLSFQHDSGKKILKPEGEFGPSLGFGLYLVGQGYNELKMSLDGKDGRPSLAQLKDGNSHHVVATYNVRTGLKAIYINGVMQAHYQYPPGSKMLSGGSGTANIGNSPNALDNHGEAYAGTIDEVAFYDFALPNYMVKLHYEWVRQGINYFGQKPNADPLPQSLSLQLPPKQSFKLDPTTGLPMLP